MKKLNKNIYVGMSANLGHMNILKEAAKLGNVTASLRTDKAITSYKRLPYMTYIQRKEVIENIKGVVEVIPQETLDCRPNLELLKQDIVVHESNWKEGVQSKTRQQVIDTLSHAVESIWNKNASPITLNYMIKSTKLIVDNIVPLSNNLDNLEYRDNVMRTCTYEGLAFSNTKTAISHGMSYYITAHKGVDHGIACSFTLPMLIDNVITKYDFIDNALEEIFGELSSQRLRAILKELEIYTEFRDCVIEESELIELKLSLQNNQRSKNSKVTI